MPSEPAPADPRFAGIEYVVKDDDKFIRMLGIGENASKTLKIGRTVGEVVHVSAAATAGAAVASSATVASTFFAGTGWLAVLGLGGAAVTPIGWVVAAAVVTGGAYYGVMRACGAYEDVLMHPRVPKFINTPIDILGAAIVDMMGGIALRVAQADGAICCKERAHIRDYFVESWGIDLCYAKAALAVLEENLAKATLDDEVKAFTRFVRANPDGDLEALRSRVDELLTELVELDGRVTDRERGAIERVLAGLRPARLVDRLPTAPPLPDLRGTWVGRVFLGVDPEKAKELAAQNPTH